MEDFGLNKRFAQFDGLRGWAALIVVCSHIKGLNLMPGQGSVDERIMQIWDGSVAVIIFWIMSGFVLSRGIQYAAFKQSGNPNASPRGYIVQAYLRRYPRLIIPAVVSCIWMYLLFATGAINFELKGLPDSEWLRTSAFNFNLRPYDIDNYSLKNAITSGMNFIRNFVPGYNPTTDIYNPVLWTMKGEILGSFAVFTFFLFKPRIIWLLCSFLLVAGGIYHITWLQCFMVGTFLALLMVSNSGSTIRKGMILLGLTIFLLTMWHIGWTSREMLLAYAIVVLVTFVPFFSATCSNRLSLFLGKVSFPVYLIHFGILFSLGRYLVSLVIPVAGLYAAQWVCLATTLILSCLLGSCMEKYIDAPAISLSKKIASSLYNWVISLKRKPERKRH